MKKPTLGALAMVVMGAVTFSVTNGLLSDQPVKNKKAAQASNHSGVQIAADTNNPKKTVKDQTSETKYSLKKPDLQTNINNGNRSDNSEAIIPKNTETKIAANVTANSTASKANTVTTVNSAASATTSTQPTASAPAAVSKVSNSSPTTAASTQTTATASQTTSTASTAANHGQQISLAAKEKNAVSRTK